MILKRASKKNGNLGYKVMESRNPDDLSDLLDEDFVFVRHQSGKEMSKEDVLNMWNSYGPRPEIEKSRVIYENEQILVTHQLMTFPSGANEAKMMVYEIKNELIYIMEPGATPISS